MEEKLAYIISQTAMMNAEIALANTYSKKRFNFCNGLAVNARENAIRDIIKKYEPVLNHDAVLTYLRS